MKKIFKVFFGIELALISLILIFSANLRKINAKVYEISQNIVTFQDICGNLWEYEDANGIFSQNEKVRLTFNDKGTDFLEDDVIIKVEVIEW